MQHRADKQAQRQAINSYVTQGGDVPDRLLPTPFHRKDFVTPGAGDTILLTLPSPNGKGMKAHVFRVMTAHADAPWMPSPISKGLTLKVRVDESAPRGRKWNLRGLQVGQTVFWGTAAFEIAGRTGKSLRIRLMDVYDEDETNPQGANEEMDFSTSDKDIPCNARGESRIRLSNGKTAMRVVKYEVDTGNYIAAVGGDLATLRRIPEGEDVTTSGNPVHFHEVSRSAS